MFKLDDTLDKVKELHSHSILNNDDYYIDRLLEIIIDLSTIDNQLLVGGKSEINEDEIEKVKRKVPKWMTKTHQYNYQILKAYMDLSDCNKIPIPVDVLEDYSEMSEMFLGHYNAMKIISEKNHAKVFEETDKVVELWKPVAKFIEDTFKCHQTIHKKHHYSFDGKIYKKNNKSGLGLGRLLFDIFKKYLIENPNKSYLEIQAIFNPLHDRFSNETNNQKVVLDEDDYNLWYMGKTKDSKRDRRYFEPIVYNGYNIYFTTQWGDTNGNITDFIAFAKDKLGYDIVEL